MAAKADWMDRALAGVDDGGMSLARALVTVAPRVPTFYPPLRAAAALVSVGVEPMEAAGPAEAWTADADPAFIGEDAEYGNADNDLAALRACLMAAVEWGAVSTVAALVMVGGVPTVLRLVGCEAAIRQALPDAETVAAWREAGVTEFPMQLDPGEGQLRRVTWVPIDRVPVILQLERAWRGLADG